jgi:hypothetical protein
MKRIWLGWLLGIIAIAALGQNRSSRHADPFASYREVPFGAALTLELRTELGRDLLCAEPWVQDERITCMGSRTIGDVPTTDEMIFIRGKFVAARVRFRSDSFSSMAAIFTARYGKPAKRINPEVSNRLGGRFENNKIFWTGKRVTVLLSRFGEKLDEGYALISLNSYLSEFTKDEERKAKEAARAF